MKNKEDILNNFLNEELISRPQLLNKKLTHKNKELNHRHIFYEIKEYLDDFLEGNISNRFIVLPGLRGVGKTTIIYQLYDYLLKTKNIKQNMILYISGDILNSYLEFNILEAVEHYLKTIHNTTLMELDEKLFIFIDESQYDDRWSLAGKIIFDKTNNIFMIFTGSQALNLEINVDSARRHLRIPINPMNYNEYLLLKYDFYKEDNSIKELIFTGNIENAITFENNIQKKLLNIPYFQVNEWENYLKYGGFPSSLFEKNKYVICQKLNEIINKIVENDLNNISSDSKIYASRILRFLSLQKPGEVSQNKIADFLDCSSGNVKNIISILEKTHVIFHVEPYSSSSKRIRKSWKYYFATPSLRHSLSLNIGTISRDLNAYMGILSENLVGSLLFNLSNDFNIYYDSEKGGVDFILQTFMNNAIPIEVGYSKKSKKQIKNAISRYNADYGIIISNTTSKIKKEENIIYLPLQTFSFI